MALFASDHAVTWLHYTLRNMRMCVWGGEGGKEHNNPSRKPEKKLAIYPHEEGQVVVRDRETASVYYCGSPSLQPEEPLDGRIDIHPQSRIVCRHEITRISELSGTKPRLLRPRGAPEIVVLDASPRVYTGSMREYSDWNVGSPHPPVVSKNGSSVRGQESKPDDF